MRANMQWTLQPHLTVYLVTKFADLEYYTGGDASSPTLLENWGVDNDTYYVYGG